MKVIINLLVFAALLVPFNNYAQNYPPSGTAVSGGTITVKGSQIGQDIYQRDEVDLVPNIVNAEIHITPNNGTNTDAHLYLDPNIILPTQYSSSGVNTNGSTGSSSSSNPGPADPSLTFGATNGSFAVSQGAAIYNIPIVVPPGTAGMAPNVSVSYNSRNLSGIVGDGWSLNATSVIKRVNQNLYHDGIVQPIQFAIGDALSLDGNRLVFNDAATNYVCENEDFSVVSYVSGSGTSGDYFIVKGRDGKTREYGSLADTKMQFPFGLLATKLTYAWYLSKMYDNYGNTITYTYKKNPTTISSNTYNELALSQIDYTQNSTVSPPINSYNSIKFDYEQRTDINSSFVLSNLLGSTLLLREIEIDCEGVFMKRYEFNYGANSIGQSYLNEVKEYGSDLSSLNSTVITYATTQAPAVSTTNSNHVIDNSNLPSGKKYFSGDFNGDGRADLIGFDYVYFDPLKVITYNSNTLYINNDNGLTYTSHGGFTVPSGVNSLLGVSRFKSAGEAGNINVVDVNADGMDDIVLTSSYNNVISVGTYLSNGTGFTQQNVMTFPDSEFSLCFADVTGDGKPEGILNITVIIALPAIFNVTNYNTLFTVFDLMSGVSSTTNNILDLSGGLQNTGINNDQSILYGLSAVDFDGDGKSELLTSDKAHFNIVRPYWDASGNVNKIQTIWQITKDNSDDMMQVADFNGDGISDYLVTPKNDGSHPFIYYGTGTGITAANTISSAPGYQNNSVTEYGSYPLAAILGFAPETEDLTVNQHILSDMNGDGKTDILFFHSTPQLIKYSILDPDNALNVLGVVYDIKPSTFDYSICYGTGNINATLSLTKIGDLNGNVPVTIDPSIASCMPEFNVGDFNGDGFNDICFKEQQVNYIPPQIDYYDNGIIKDITVYKDSRRIILSPYTGNFTQLATSITDGNGFKTTVAYNSIAAIDNTTIPNVTGSYMVSSAYEKGTNTSAFPIVQTQKPIQVVTGVTIPNGAGGTSTTTYTYADAQVHKQGGGFLGFSKIIEKNADANTATEKDYYTQTTSRQTANIVEKVPKSVATSFTNADGTFTNKTDYTYNIYPLSVNSLHHFTALTNKNQLSISGASTATSYTYDNNLNSPTNDNLTNIFTTINGVETQSVTNVYTTFTDFSSTPSRLQNTKTTISRTGQSDYTREISYTYTDEGAIKTSTTDPSLAKKVLTEYTYFDAGTVKTSNVSSPDANTTATGNEYTYENNYRFVASTKNKLGQLTASTYDPKWGKPLTVTNPNNLLTQYTYDGYGKNTSVTTADGLSAHTSYDWVTMGDFTTWQNDPLDVKDNLLYKITVTADGKPTVTTFYDQMMRPLKSISDGFNNPLSIISTYDLLGHPSQKTNGYEGISNADHKPLLTSFNYDNMGRLISSVLNDVATGNTQLKVNNSYLYSSGTTSITSHVNTTSSNPKTILKVYDATGLLITSSDDATSGGSNPGLSFTYGGHHNPIDIALQGNNIMHYTYDDYGRKTSQVEPNTGTSTYEYNAFAQPYTQNDNSNQHAYTYSYDALGRVTEMTSQGEGGSYLYQYNGLGNGLNQVKKITAPNGMDCNYTYDGLDRPTQVTQNVGASQPFTTTYGYDVYSNIAKMVYPGGFAVNREYDNHSFLKKVTRADNNNAIFQTNTIDAFGHFSNYNLGNGINVHKTYTDFGYASHYAAQGINAIQDYDLSFDPLTGNLSSRRDNLHNQYENFIYDVNDRLKTVSGSSALSMNYYPNGNIQNKSDVGDYTYNPVKVNALAQVTNPNGNISSNTQTVDYTSFNKTSTVKEIDVNTPSNTLNQVDYTYNPFQQRCKSSLYGPGGSPISTTFYQQNYEKTLSPNGTNFTETSYINGGDGLNALFINDDAGNGKLYFVFTDHLGSILKLTDENGISVAEQSFDAWGKPRSPSSWNAAPASSSVAGLIRGYTCHEHLPQFNLINMNGRMYDPNTARFLSADNNVEDGENTQSYNRYSYCSNNPLKYTDPTGYDWVGQTDGTYNWSTIPGEGDATAIWTNSEGFTVYGDEAGYANVASSQDVVVDGNITESDGGLTNETVATGNLNSEDVQNGNGWANNVENGLGAFGFANEGKNALIEYASKVGNIGDDALNYLKISKGLSTTVGAAGLLVTVADGLTGEEGWQNHHTADLLIGAGSVFLLSGPWGWAIGGAYFLTDMAVQSYTGRSITENLFDPTPNINPNK